MAAHLSGTCFVTLPHELLVAGAPAVVEGTPDLLQPLAEDEALHDIRHPSALLQVSRVLPPPLPTPAPAPAASSAARVSHLTICV